MTAELVGRSAISPVVRSMEAPPPDPRVDAAAHVICVMGGHLPNRDNERPGACSFHRKQAAFALAQADLAWLREVS